jgi:hypothetical protein
MTACQTHVIPVHDSRNMSEQKIHSPYCPYSKNSKIIKLFPSEGKNFLMIDEIGYTCGLDVYR